MADQDTCVIDGVTYVAADSAAPGGRGGCATCAGMLERGLCRRMPPCSQCSGRGDGRFIEWHREAVKAEGGAA